MGWKLTTAQKIRTAASLIMVFLLILATNMIDNHHFEIVKRSLTTIYEDRLVAKDYIYNISRQIQVKRNLLLNGDQADIIRINENANEAIRTLISRYEETKLTVEEAKRFDDLKEKLTALFQYEESYTEEQDVDRELPAIDEAESYYAEIYEELDALSDIQVGEGKRELDLSTKSIENSLFISKLEIAALIFIGLILQLLIFIKPVK